MNARSARNKATHRQLRQHNQQLVLRAIYDGVANSRAALAQETGLAKPTVSELIGELIEAGLLVEEGRGHSTRGGGKRPRLLKFVPQARHVIGLSINDDHVIGGLSDLNGQVVAWHCVPLDGAHGDAVIEVLSAAINGLLAQLDAPLLCMGVGVPGVVDAEAGVVQYAPHIGWRDVPLARVLRQRYRVPVYLANSTALMAMAEYVYGPADQVSCFAAVRVGASVGVGLVINGAIYHGGGEIGHLRLEAHSPVEAGPDMAGRLITFLGWPYVQQRALTLRRAYPHSLLPADAASLSYLHIHYAAINGDPAALALRDELSQSLAQVFAWIIGLLRPDHVSLAGPIADLGEPFLDQTIAHARALLLPELVERVAFSLSTSPNLVALGAIAQSLHLELGLV
jgi:predicted NBD/HSP70 family sugar kinase